MQFSEPTTGLVWVYLSPCVERVAKSSFVSQDLHLLLLRRVIVVKEVVSVGHRAYTLRLIRADCMFCRNVVRNCLASSLCSGVPIGLTSSTPLRAFSRS